MAPKKAAAPKKKTTTPAASTSTGTKRARPSGKQDESNENTKSSSSSAPAAKKSKKETKKKAAAPKEMPPKAPAKSKKKKQEVEVVIDSSSDHEGAAQDSDVIVIDSPPRKPKASKAKAPPKKASPAKPKVPLTFEEAFQQWFDQYKDEDDDRKIGGEGIEKLFGDMELSMEGILPFLLAWQCHSAPGTFGSLEYGNLEAYFRPLQITSSSSLATQLEATESQLYSSSSSSTKNKAKRPKAYSSDEEDSESEEEREDNVELRSLYMFVFTYAKESAQRSLPGEMANALWEIILAPKFTLAKEMVEYVKTLGDSFKGVSADLWTQLWDFVITVDAEDLSGYNEDDAWPSLIDSFVEYKNSQKDT